MASLNLLKQNSISPICKYLSLDPKVYLDHEDTDLRSLCTRILKSTTDGDTVLNDKEVQKTVKNIEPESTTTKAVHETKEASSTKAESKADQGFFPTLCGVKSSEEC